MDWIYEYPNWPNFTWNLSDDEYTTILQARKKQEEINTKLEKLCLISKNRYIVENFTSEIIASNKIEGENLPADEIRLSLERKFGLVSSRESNHRIDNIIEIYLDAIYSQESLSKERIWAWHAALFPTGYSGIHKIVVGDWRNSSMQVVSGSIGKEWIHYIAPPASRVPSEMERFFDWLKANGKYGTIDPIIKSGIAHLWFVLIHPLSDGNGRIARLLSSAILSSAEKPILHFYSLSSEYTKDINKYYKILDLYNKNNFDITPWIKYQISIFSQAINSAEVKINDMIWKNKVWSQFLSAGLSRRQHKVIGKLLDNFQGKLSVRKYSKLAKCSIMDAKSDIEQMIRSGIIKLISDDTYILSEEKRVLCKKS